MNGYLEYGSYWTMVKSAWKRRNHSNMKFMWFEEMKQDLSQVILEVAQFLGHSITESQIQELENHLHIDNFRNIITNGYGNDPVMKNFIRKGEIGNWKKYFNGSNNRDWDSWIANEITKADLKILNDYFFV